jgi:hypothetical protein
MLRSVMLYNIRGRLGDFCFMFQLKEGSCESRKQMLKKKFVRFGF